MKRWLYNEPWLAASFLIGGVGLAMPVVAVKTGYVTEWMDVGGAVMCPIRDLGYEGVHAKFNKA